MRHIHRSAGVLVLLAVTFVVVFGGVGAAAASTANTTAGDVTVSLEPTDQTVDPGQEATYDIVVDEVSDGISAYKMTVELTDTSVATVESYAHNYDPMFDNTETYDDRVEVSAAMGDNVINGTDGAVLGTVTVLGEGNGVTDVSFADDASGIDLTDEGDNYYNVTGATDGTLTVDWPEVDVALTPADQTVGVGGETAYDIVVEGATDGISAYQGTIALDNTSVATVESYEHNYDPMFDDTEVSDDRLNLSAAMGDEPITGADEIVLGTVTLSGQTTGTTAFTFGDNLEVALDDEEVTSYSLDKVTDGSLDVVEQYQPATVDVVPMSGVSVGEVTLGVVVTGAENGINAYDLNFSLNNSLASFTDYELTAEGSSGPLDDSKITDSGSTLSLTAALLDAAHAPAEETHIANAVLEVDEPGAVTIEALGGELSDQDDSKYTLTLNDRDLSVQEIPPIEGDLPPQDTTGDGLYDDIDGDGKLGIFDVQALFQNLDSPEVQSNAAFFDFDNSGGDKISVFDVQGLFDMATGAPAN